MVKGFGTKLGLDAFGDAGGLPTTNGTDANGEEGKKEHRQADGPEKAGSVGERVVTEAEPVASPRHDSGGAGRVEHGVIDGELASCGDSKT